MALTIAGFDCSCGAGLMADCRSFERLGVYGVATATAVVAQRPGSVSSLEAMSPDLVEAQLEELGKGFPISAAKTGMLANEQIAMRAAEFFELHPDIPLVIDPVLRASAGKSLLSTPALDVLKEKLFPRSILVTPNVLEAEAILGIEIRNRDNLISAAEVFSSQFGCDVLIKGGHLDESADQICDTLSINGEVEWLTADRLKVPDLHGTGCTLSAAITAGLAKGLAIREAVQLGRAFLRDQMANYHTWPGGTRALSIGSSKRTPHSRSPLS